LSCSITQSITRSLPPSRHRPFFFNFFLPHLTSELRQAQLKPLTNKSAYTAHYCPAAAGTLKEIIITATISLRLVWK
jgi:hypothetical protein